MFPRARRVLSAVAVAAAFVPFAAGCGSSDPTPTAADRPASGGGTGGTGDTGGAAAPAGCESTADIQLCLSYQITGAETLTGKRAGYATDGQGDTALKTCADYAKGAPDGDDGEPQLYLPQGGAITAETPFGAMTGSTIQHYKGPGTYGRETLSGQGSEAGLLIGGKDYGQFSSSATASVTINPDGSGSYTFAGLSTYDDKKNTISGTVTWTCSTK